MPSAVKAWSLNHRTTRDGVLTTEPLGNSSFLFLNLWLNIKQDHLEGLGKFCFCHFWSINKKDLHFGICPQAMSMEGLLRNKICWLLGRSHKPYMEIVLLPFFARLCVSTSAALSNIILTTSLGASCQIPVFKTRPGAPANGLPRLAQLVRSGAGVWRQVCLSKALSPRSPGPQNSPVSSVKPWQCSLRLAPLPCNNVTLCHPLALSLEQAGSPHCNSWSLHVSFGPLGGDLKP